MSERTTPKVDSATLSIFAFGAYMIVVGLTLLAIPDRLLAFFGFPPTNEVWVHFLGLLIAILGAYYLRAARNRLTIFYHMTVMGRLALATGMVAFVVLRWAVPWLLLAAGVECLGALWTGIALRKAAQTGKNRAIHAFEMLVMHDSIRKDAKPPRS